MSARTNGEVLGPAMAITDQVEADAYFEKMVEEGLALDPKLTREVAEKNLRSSLGYWAGYYDAETRERVERLYRCAHPVFGPIATKGRPSTDGALLAGVNLARGRS